MTAVDGLESFIYGANCASKTPINNGWTANTAGNSVLLPFPFSSARSNYERRQSPICMLHDFMLQWKFVRGNFDSDVIPPNETSYMLYANINPSEFEIVFEQASLLKEPYSVRTLLVFKLIVRLIGTSRNSELSISSHFTVIVKRNIQWRYIDIDMFFLRFRLLLH